LVNSNAYARLGVIGLGLLLTACTPKADPAAEKPAVAENSRPAPETDLDDPNITSDQVMAILRRESDKVPIDYLNAFKVRVAEDLRRLPMEGTREDAARGTQRLASYWRMVREMPTDSGRGSILMRAPEFFEGDIFDVWGVFNSSAKKMRTEGLEVAPTQLIATALVVFEKSGVSPAANERPAEFCAVYRELRKQGGMLHGQALNEMVRRRKG
jgi:hypothetical protein